MRRLSRLRPHKLILVVNDATFVAEVNSSREMNSRGRLEAAAADRALYGARREQLR
jgi:hypothetical protein